MVVDDDVDLCKLLATTLNKAGFEVVTFHEGGEALEKFENYRPALVVLDVMLPEMDGWQVLHEIRDRSDVPVLMLTALSREPDQLKGLEGGADDYVVKPFSLQQLMARVRAILRRTGYSGQYIVRGPLILDPSSHEIKVDGKPISLTRREFALLEVLVQFPGRAFTRSELLARCWGPNYDGVDRVVDVHLASLRAKLGDKRDLISTVRGVGYRLNLE